MRRTADVPATLLCDAGSMTSEERLDPVAGALLGRCKRLRARRPRRAVLRARRPRNRNPRFHSRRSIMTATTPPTGSYRLPSLERALVGDVMHPGVVSCPPETSLAGVARIMASHHIHAVVVSGIERTRGGEHLA